MTALFDDDTDERLYLQLHNLKIVGAVAASGTATAAGQLLFKSPSTIVRGVGEVEDALGVALFERGAAGFTPNAYGKILLMRIRRIEAELALVAADLGRAPAKGTPLSPSALQYLLWNGRKLLLLVHLAESKTIVGTAAALAIGQSGASMALARIEEALGTRLFYRNGQGMTPTDAAAKLILHAKRMRAELRHAASELSSVAGRPVGTTVIGTLPMARIDILPQAISECLAQYPGIQIQTNEAPGAALIAQLRAGDIDAVVSVPRASFEPTGLTIEPLCLDELVVVASAHHPLARVAGLTLADIATAQWILPWRNSVSRTMFAAQFTAQGIAAPRPAVETADLALMRMLLSKGEMLALTSLRYVRFELEAQLFARLDVRMDRIEREVVLLRREATELSPAAMALVDAIRAAATI